ncbi:hypothetical protein OQA88_9104 [Cercophora sp. LCS_1]
MASGMTMTGACPPSASCTAYGVGTATFWAPKIYSETRKTGTVTVVHIVNTVAGSTSISTIANNVPPGFTPPPTNFGGTRTARATYERFGSNSTTTVTYPTPFVDMPDTYSVVGDYQLNSPSDGTKKCVLNAYKAFDIPVNWQPKWAVNDPEWDLDESGYDPKDELGWSFSYLGSSKLVGSYVIHQLVDLIPDDNPDMPHSVVKACKTPDYVSPAAVTAVPNWKVIGVKSISYEGSSPTAARRAAENLGNETLT